MHGVWEVPNTNTKYMALFPVAEDEGGKLDQIQHRLLSFEAGWPRLKRWLQKFRILTTIITNQDIGRYIETHTHTSHNLPSHSMATLYTESIVDAVHEKVKDIINKVLL